MKKLTLHCSDIILSIPELGIPPGFGTAVLVDPGTPIPTLRGAGRAAYIEDGIIRVTARGGTHGGAIVGYRSKGWIVGDLLPNSATPFPLMASAVTRCTIRNAITSGIQFLSPSEREVFLGHVAAMYACEIEAMIQREAELYTRSPMDRLCNFIQEFAARCGTPTEEGTVQLRFPVRQVELSRYLHLSPEHVNRMIHRLRDRDIIVDLKWPLITINTTALHSLIEAGEAQDLT